MRTTTASEIFQYWEKVRGKDAAPLRRQIEPGDIRHILADLFILEKDADTAFRFRLAGTRLCALFGRELRGATFDGLWSCADMDMIAGTAERVVADHAPVLLSASGTSAFKDHLDVELAMLPLRSGQGPADRIIGSLAPLTRPSWIGGYPLPFLRLVDVSFPAPGSLVHVRPPAARMAEGGSGRWPVGAVGQAMRRVLHLGVLDGGRGD